MKQPLCIGHRGARGHAPENTLLSIQTAIDMGCDWIEVDIHAVQGRLLLMHGRWLHTTTNGVGLICEQSLGYLRGLDAGRGEKIPYLEEVLDLVAGQVGLNIEIKSAACAQLLAKTLQSNLTKKYWEPTQFSVSSFNHVELLKFHDALPQIPLGALYCGIPANYAAGAEKLGAQSINLDIDFVNQEFVTNAKQHGLKVYVYTANHEADIRSMLALGVDGLFTDYPDRVLAIRDEKQG